MALFGGSTERQNAKARKYYWSHLDKCRAAKRASVGKYFSSRPGLKRQINARYRLKTIGFQWPKGSRRIIMESYRDELNSLRMVEWENIHPELLAWKNRKRPISERERSADTIRCRIASRNLSDNYVTKTLLKLIGQQLGNRDKPPLGLRDSLPRYWVELKREQLTNARLLKENHYE